MDDALVLLQKRTREYTRVVLILVVMDDALVLMNMMKSWLKDIDVLILVVMDDALVRENATATTFDHDTVLILVVMDDALVRI